MEGVRSVPLHAPYIASKWALRGFYDALRMELAESKDPVAVVTVLPAAIVRAAEHPTREVPVGGSVAAAILSQRLSPALTDTLLSFTRTGVGAQVAGRRDNATDVDGPVAEAGQVHGTYSGRVLTRSVFTDLLGHRRRPGELVGSVVQTIRRRG
jgi:NAD(P)-dependent dehydrogenase (short-subunit alcohol dehydrogenase family)